MDDRHPGSSQNRQADTLIWSPQENSAIFQRARHSATPQDPGGPGCPPSPRWQALPRASSSAGQNLPLSAALIDQVPGGP